MDVNAKINSLDKPNFSHSDRCNYDFHDYYHLKRQQFAPILARIEKYYLQNNFFTSPNLSIFLHIYLDSAQYHPL